MRRLVEAVTAALIAGMATAAIANPPAVPVPTGVWANPKETVKVRFRACGQAMCGRVVWASPQAEADARSGSDGPLVGTDLFRDFVAEGSGVWSGSVLVPDLGQSVTGTITRSGPNTLIGEGCLFAGIGCKRQVWHKVG